MKVPRRNTPIDVGQMVASLRRAWNSLLGKDPTKEQLAMILAQNALETNHRQAMFNYNVGNIMHMGTDSHDYFENRDSYGGKSFVAKFRSYPSLDDGVLDYLKLLVKGYPQAFRAAKIGDPKQYAQALIANPQRQYYDPHVQKQYVSGMSGLYDQYLKSPELTTLVSTKPSRAALLRRILEHSKGREREVIEKLFRKKRPHLPKPTPSLTSTTPPVKDISTILDTFLQRAASSKHLYQSLPKNHLVIQVKTADYVDAIEFARVLCAALDEELQATAYTHTDGQQVEVECAVHGSEQSCLKAVQQLSRSLSDMFQEATTKIGGVYVETQCLPNQKTSLQEIDFKSAQFQYRKFHLKFAKGNTQ
jgi:hypothetical protein